MKILVVDDETFSRDRMSRMLDADGTHEVVGEAGNGFQAITLCEELQPDVVLLDIRMPGMDGLETARHFLTLNDPPAVIFCTAFEEHAIQAFDLQAVGYLLKPIRKDKLIAALDKLNKLNRAQLAAISTVGAVQRSHISARTHRGIELVPLNEVRYFQADRKYVTVGHVSGEVIIDDTLRELEEEFAERFVRVHRSTLVSKHHIQALIKEPDGQIGVRMQGLNDIISISRRHLPGVRKTIKRL